MDNAGGFVAMIMLVLLLGVVGGMAGTCNGDIEPAQKLGVVKAIEQTSTVPPIFVVRTTKYEVDVYGTEVTGVMVGDAVAVGKWNGAYRVYNLWRFTVGENVCGKVRERKVGQ